MKKALSILFLFIFIYNLFGYYTVFKVLQNHVRDEVKQRIKHSVPDDELVLISVSATDNYSLIWTKPNKEFRYRGEMYDIVRLETKRDLILYYCIHDFKESKLFANIDDHIQRHIADNPEQRKEVENILIKLAKVYFFQVISINSPDETQLDVKYETYFLTYNSICLGIVTPPPKLV